MSPVGVNLTGGGARGSYQAGVLLGIGEILKKNGQLGHHNPLKIWSGSSAGAINATYCAAQADDLYRTTQGLAKLWSQIKPNQVYLTDLMSLGANSARWIRDLSFGPLFKKKLANSLLDTSPLLQLLNENIPFENIQYCIDKGYLNGLTCSAYCFNNSKTISFIQAKDDVSWDRPRRASQKTMIHAEHIMASCSIPLLFPPTTIQGQYYGDGGFRNTTPMSPTLHLGAQKILMIGVRYQGIEDDIQNTEPGVAKVAGSMLNALFFDNLDVDIERINHINEMIQALDQNIVTQRSDYSSIDYKVIRPSANIAKLASQSSDKSFPKMLQFLLDGLGSKKDTADLSSYILFDSSFTNQLIELGYADLMARRDEIEAWICQ